MSSIDVRRIQPSEHVAVIALWAEVFGYTQARNDPAGVLATKLAWDGRVLVAVEGARVLGSVMLGYDGHRGWLYRVAVAPDARRRGIGRRLVRAAEQELAALGCRKINLQLHVHNEAGRAFWGALGYACEPRLDLGKELPEPAATREG